MDFRRTSSQISSESTIFRWIFDDIIRITPEAVDGSGPLYKRVAVIADDWLKEHGLT